MRPLNVKCLINTLLQMPEISHSQSHLLKFCCYEKLLSIKIMKIKVLSLVFLFLGVTSCLKSPVDGVQVLEVSKYEKKMTESDVQLVDVRTPEEFSEGHLENAINIDVTADDFDAKVASLDKEKPVMVYCKSGGRSALMSGKMVSASCGTKRTSSQAVAVSGILLKLLFGVSILAKLIELFHSSTFGFGIFSDNRAKKVFSFSKAFWPRQGYAP